MARKLLSLDDVSTPSEPCRGICIPQSFVYWIAVTGGLGAFVPARYTYAFCWMMLAAGVALLIRGAWKTLRGSTR